MGGFGWFGRVRGWVMGMWVGGCAGGNWVSGWRGLLGRRTQTAQLSSNTQEKGRIYIYYGAKIVAATPRTITAAPHRQLAPPTAFSFLCPPPGAGCVPNACAPVRPTIELTPCHWCRFLHKFLSISPLCRPGKCLVLCAMLP